MRTQKSLGYHCYSKLLIFEGILGLTYEIQTNNTPPITLSNHIQDFFSTNIPKVFNS
jgi:secreted Zn-dependent insulinase-like peptidase